MRKSELTWITPSEVIEYLYCPRFIYFMNCLLIPQNEDQRAKVQIGRNIHNIKEKINKEYLRKKLGVVKKEIDCYLSDSDLGIRGVIDEILTLEDNTMSPLDYKFAEFKDKVYDTLKYQAVIYALLIEKNYNVKVNQAFICYIRSKNHIEKIEISDAYRKKTLEIISEICYIIECSYFPKSTKIKNRCIDCCYHKICVK